MSHCEAKLLQATQRNPVTAYCAENGPHGVLYFMALETKLPTNNENNNNQAQALHNCNFLLQRFAFHFLNERVTCDAQQTYALESLNFYFVCQKHNMLLIMLKHSS